MSKLVEYSEVLWFSAVLVFMVLSVVVSVVQHFRRKHLVDLPGFVMAPIMLLWFIVAAAGIATAMLAMLVPIVHGFMR